MKSEGLVLTAAAAAKLGISSTQLLRITRVREIAPDKVAKTRHGGAIYFWRAKTISRLAKTADVVTARGRRGGAPPKDYASIFAKRYDDSPHGALADACDALFNLNRYTRHSTCSAANRGKILDLKTKLIECLYRLERFTDRVEKLTRRLPAKMCFRCNGTRDVPRDRCYDDSDSLCERCGGTGEFAPAREVASFVFTFTVQGRQYTWMQPDHVMTFVPRVEATRQDDGKPRELDKTLNVPRNKLAEAKALVLYALGAVPPAASDLAGGAPDLREASAPS